jgi:hypothetical protein
MYYLYQLSRPSHYQPTNISIQMASSINAPQSVSPNSVSPIVPIVPIGQQPQPQQPSHAETISTSSTSSASSTSSTSSISHVNANDAQIRPQIVELFPVRIIIAALWLLLVQMVVSNTLIARSIFIFIKNATTCFGILFILAMIVVPVAYTIHPKTVIDFKFASFAPQIADGLRKLDYFVNRLAHATRKKAEKW